MGIGRKSRKLKGKKRQTGRKIRRGTRRSRLGRRSRMKGGSVPVHPGGQPEASAAAGEVDNPEAGQPEAAQPEAAQPGEDDVVRAIDGVSTGCDSITSLIDELTGQTKNLFEDQAKVAEQAKTTVLELRQQIEELTAKNTEALEKLTAEHAEAAAQAQGEVGRLTSELTAAQAAGTANTEGLEKQLKVANAALEKEKQAKADVDADLENARADAVAAAADSDAAAARASAKIQQDRANLQKISEMMNAINAKVEELRSKCVEKIQGSLINLIKDLYGKKCLEMGQAKNFLEKLGLSGADLIPD